MERNRIMEMFEEDIDPGNCDFAKGPDLSSSVRLFRANVYAQNKEQAIEHFSNELKKYLSEFVTEKSAKDGFNKYTLTLVSVNLLEDSGCK